MVDTIRTRAELVTAYADNITRAILAQTHRDNVISQMSCTGQLTGPDLPLATTTSPVAISFNNSGSSSGGITADPLFNYLEIATGGDGIYLIGFSLELISGQSNNTTVTVEVYVDALLVLDKTFPITNQNAAVELSFISLTSPLVAGERITLGILGSAAGSIVWGGGLLFLSRQAGTP